MSVVLPEQQTKRRSRMRRQSSGKRIELSPRDIEIFRLLQRYRYLRSTFLHAFVGGRQETRFKERLGQLYHDGRYINRPEEQWLFANARCAPIIYELDERGAAILRQHEVQDRSVSVLSEQSRPGANRQFAHALMICEALASIELGARASGDVRFIAWPEILARAPENARHAVSSMKLPVTITHRFARSGKTDSAAFNLIPDALFGLEYRQPDERSSYRFFALEAERSNRVAASNLRQTSFLKKVLAYRDIVARQTHRSALGLPNLLVLTVTTSKARIETMKASVMEVTSGKGSGLFLFKEVPALGHFFNVARPTTELFTSAWERAGHPDLHIVRP
jgi:hypothetical protein